MSTPFLEDPRLRSSLLKEPHFKRVIILRRGNQNGLVWHELNAGDGVASMRGLDDRMNFLLVEIPKSDT